MTKKMIKIFIINIIIVITLFNLSCSKNKIEDPQSNLQEINLTIPVDSDFFAILDQQNIKQVEILKKILGNKLLDKAKQDSIMVELVAHKDSLDIVSCKVEAFNAKFAILASTKDSTMFDVVVEKPILKGGSIFQVLTDVGMKAKDVGYYAWKLGEYIEATSIDVGDIITVNYSLDSLQTKKFDKFSYKPDKTSIHEFYIKGPRELEYNKITLPYELKRRVVKGELTAENWTLDAALANLDVIPYIRQQANNAMESQIAFSTDARIGDAFEVYIEEKYVEGEKQPRGKVLFAKYVGKRAGTKYAYRYNDSAEASAFTGMYTSKGKRLVTDAVRTPLDRMHVSSSFGYRIHPISGKRKLHTGIDLRGGTGTPVYAVSSGTVTKASNSGNGFGKAVRIRHENGMISHYAHLNSIKTRKGRRVKKGQYIGTVGSTGYSTGPHLHFGVMKNGRWVNPKTNLRMVGANQLKDKRLQEFKAQIKEFSAEIEQIAETDSVITRAFNNEITVR